MSYKETALMRAEKAAKRAQELLEQERRSHESTRASRDRAVQESNRQERRVRSLKGVVTTTKRRIVRGSCPCCSKSFADLAQHMAEKHPTYADKEKG